MGQLKSGRPTTSIGASTARACCTSSARVSGFTAILEPSQLELGVAIFGYREQVLDPTPDQAPRSGPTAAPNFPLPRTNPDWIAAILPKPAPTSPARQTAESTCLALRPFFQIRAPADLPSQL